jgi:hypothetical protein
LRKKPMNKTIPIFYHLDVWISDGTVLELIIGANIIRN